MATEPAATGSSPHSSASVSTPAPAVSGAQPSRSRISPATPKAITIQELTPALELVTVTIPAAQTSENESEKQVATGTVPSTVRKILRATDPKRPFLPGQPRVRLEPAPGSGGPAEDETDPGHHNEVLDYLRKAHLTKELDSLLPFMKYIFVQTPSHKHIMALHHQQAHGREIIVNEHPGLHLVWYYERIFIKPIPAYMYSQAFWTYLHDADPAAYAAALGFMRSWYYLVQYDIDYQLACERRLIPKLPPSSSPSLSSSSTPTTSKEVSNEDPQHPTYEQFVSFIRPFSRAPDEAVNLRFSSYGELRLTRINKTALLFRGKLAYFQIHPQWGSYLSHIIAPVVTVFAILSVILNAMQVTLAARQLDPTAAPAADSGSGSVPPDDSTWQPFLNVSTYFPVAIMVAIAGLIGAGVVGVLAMGLKDLVRTKWVRHRRKRGDGKVGEKSYGLIW